MRHGLTLGEAAAWFVHHFHLSLDWRVIPMEGYRPDDAPGFRTWLRAIAADAADASSEGGFLGFGGVKVSEAEKATLAELDAALA
jgi:hypothetical protein